MFEEEDILETEICLRMETYKALNRELTIKNQELRQYGTALREELCDVRRRLMEERTSQATLKKAVISIISESFNRILCLMYDNETDKQLLSNGFPAGNSTQREKSGDTKNSRRSSHLARNSRGHSSLSPRKSFVDSNIVIRSPLVEIQKNNVTVRSRRAKQPEEINSKDLQQNTDDSGEAVDILDRVEYPTDVNMLSEENENSASYAYQLPVVIEETSSKMDMSSISNQRGNRVYQLKSSTSTEITGNTLMPDLCENEKSSQSRVVSSLTGSGDSRREVHQPFSSLTVPDIAFNESSFNNSSMLKAPSSTPYKRGKNNKSEDCSQRSLRVLIPKLKRSTLTRLGIKPTAIEDTHTQENDISSPKPSTSKAGKKNYVKNISPKIENPSRSDKSSPRRRPKRRAAEAAKSNLVEPTLIVKLRRQT